MSKECNQTTVTTSEQHQISLWTSWSLLAMSIWKKLSKRSQPTVIIGVVIMYLCVMSLQMVDNSKHRRSAARGQAKIIPVGLRKKSKVHYLEILEISSPKVCRQARHIRPSESPENLLLIKPNLRCKSITRI